MNRYAGKTAVITGAASGIGRALAHYGADIGQRLVLVDIEAPALEAVSAELAGKGVEVLPVAADVSRAEEVERIAHKALSHFGSVDVLFNNAGVGVSGGRAWECSLNDWEWVLRVNLWGCIHGVHYFMPAMIEQGTPAHIVNIASVAGLIAPPDMGPYNVSKFGVVALTETLFHEVSSAHPHISVSAFCPGFIQTRIHESARNRPAALRDARSDGENEPPGAEQVRENLKHAVETGIPVEKAVQALYEGMQHDQLIIYSHGWEPVALRAKNERIIAGQNPPAL